MFKALDANLEAEGIEQPLPVAARDGRLAGAAGIAQIGPGNLGHLARRDARDGGSLTPTQESFAKGHVATKRALPRARSTLPDPTDIESALGTMTKGTVLPSWAEEMKRRYLRGEAWEFVLYGNVYDLVLHQDKLITVSSFSPTSCSRRPRTRSSFIISRPESASPSANSSVDGYEDLCSQKKRARCCR